MTERTVDDRLREEYFVLLPEIKAVAEELETEVRYCLLPLSTKLDRYEQIAVASRVKDCESALQSLRRRQVPMLMGLFWQVEHSTMYKASPRLKGVAQSLEMQQRRSEVSKALRAYEDEFDRLEAIS